METWQIVLEYLKVLLSWPPIVGITIIVFMILFRDELRELLNSINEVSGPGNFSAIFEGLEENIDIDEWLKNYPKWRKLIGLVVDDFQRLKETHPPKKEEPVAKEKSDGNGG